MWIFPGKKRSHIQRKESRSVAPAHASRGVYREGYFGTFGVVPNVSGTRLHLSVCAGLTHPSGSRLMQEEGALLVLPPTMRLRCFPSTLTTGRGFLARRSSVDQSDKNIFGFSPSPSRGVHRKIEKGWRMLERRFSSAERRSPTFGDLDLRLSHVWLGQQ